MIQTILKVAKMCLPCVCPIFLSDQDLDFTKNWKPSICMILKVRVTFNLYFWRQEPSPLSRFPQQPFHIIRRNSTPKRFSRQDSASQTPKSSGQRARNKCHLQFSRFPSKSWADVSKMLVHEASLPMGCLWAAPIFGLGVMVLIGALIRQKIKRLFGVVPRLFMVLLGFDGFHLFRNG